MHYISQASTILNDKYSHFLMRLFCSVGQAVRHVQMLWGELSKWSL